MLSGVAFSVHHVAGFLSDFCCSQIPRIRTITKQEIPEPEKLHELKQLEWTSVKLIISIQPGAAKQL